VSKVLPLAEALRRHVPDGASVVLGTALECLIPFAAAHELIRQRRRDLTLVGPISDICFEQLIAAGCVRAIVAAWVGNVQHGAGYVFRRALEHGIPRPLTIEDHSNLSIALALEAAAQGVPYLPTRSLLGSDILARNPRLRETRCPFTGVPLVLVPALRPDVAILHVQRADSAGNCHAWGPTGVGASAGKASRAVIVVAEELVEPAVIRSDPNRTFLPGFLVTAVVHLPGGAHPSPVQGHYNRDHAVYADWHARSATAEGAAAWLDEWVRTPGDHAGYLAKLGAERFGRLRSRTAQLAAPVDYGC
jgi:glutaconate CoA-transferase subunit A